MLPKVIGGANGMRVTVHESAHVHFGNPAAINIPHIIHADTFGRPQLRRRHRYKGGDFAVFGAADSNSLREARIVCRVRLRISHIDHVVLIDNDVTWSTKLLPGGDELAVGLKNLNAVR
jgi:hypothetical protein